jgi:hypothetical protein
LGGLRCLSYDGEPSYTVSIMEFSGTKVARETHRSVRARRMARSLVEKMGTSSRAKCASVMDFRAAGIAAAFISGRRTRSSLCLNPRID